MWTLPKPTYSAADAFEVCISKIRDKDLKIRMTSITQAIADAADDYDDAAGLAELYLIAEVDHVDALVTAKEMVKLYNFRMVAKTAPGRVVYDSIMSLATQGRCPFCGHRVVSTLDHILSKTRYAPLTITPNNLVPCCSDCNKSKHDEAPAQATEQYIHPYFDVVDADIWLKASVLETVPAAVQFFVDPPGSWSPVTAARVQNQFKRLALAKLYSTHAAEELSGIRLQIRNLHSQAGHQAVRQHLEETYASRVNVRPNSWQSALYEALSVSTWYCDGGFN